MDEREYLESFLVDLYEKFDSTDDPAEKSRLNELINKFKNGIKNEISGEYESELDIPTNKIPQASIQKFKLNKRQVPSELDEIAIVELNSVSLSRVYFSRRSLYKIMRNTGAKMISANAIDILSVELEEFTKKITKKAIKLAKHAKRKKINESDIILALKLF